MDKKLDDVVTLSSFEFTNAAGGTGSSNWKWDEHFSGVAEAVIIRIWHDYEIGWRFIGRAVSKDLIDYLKRNANVDDQRVFFGEFDLKKEEIDNGKQ